MNEENSIVAGIRPRRTLRTKSQTKRAVIRIVPISASNAAFLSVMAVRKVDVAQWVDDVAFLYMDIRLRHQRNKTTVGRWFLHIS